MMKPNINDGETQAERTIDASEDRSVSSHASDSKEMQMETVDLEAPSNAEINDAELVAPNEPHPALEVPPLYFALKRFPQALERSKAFYSWRWSMTYPLQKRVRLGGLCRQQHLVLTIGEILIGIPLMVLGVVCVLQTFWVPNVAATGRTSRLAVVAALLFAQKNSYLTMVLGIPFDRALCYHKISGYMAVATGLLHGISHLLKQCEERNISMLSRENMVATFQRGSTDVPMNASGTAIMLCLLAMFGTSVIPYIRKRMFELFYYLHLILLLGVVGGAAVHTGVMVPLTVLLTTGVDFAIRKLFMARYRYPQKATLTVVSEHVVEVSFPKVTGFDYNPGQYVYLAIPEISHFEWHPFSLCTSPHQPKVALQIRRCGGWTSALHALAAKKTEANVLMEGPFGSFGVDVSSDRYKCVMLLSGGIGLSPMQSLFSNLVHEQMDSHRNLKKLKFVWMQRDPELIQKAEITDTTATLHESMSMTFDVKDIEAAAADAPVADNQPKQDEENCVLEMDTSFHDFDMFSDCDPSESTFDASPFAADMPFVESIDADRTQDGGSDAESGEPFANEPLAGLWGIVDIDIHVTAKDGLGTSSHHRRMPFVKRGRPNLSVLFIQMRQEAIDLGEKRVAVCVCGPKNILSACRKACVRLSDEKVRFDLHEESFGG